MERSLRLLAPLAALVTLGACSLLNAPGKEVPGSGGGNACDSCADLDDDCNTGVCNAGKCEKQPRAEGTKCDDGDFCTDGDSCHQGRCVSGDPRACPDKDACHPGSCDKQAQKCTTTLAADNTPCDDGNPCDNKGACMAGQCMNGTTKCNDPPFTTTCGNGFCEQGVGCKTQPINNGGSCMEGIAPECATGACNAGMCEPTPIAGTDGNPCASGKFCLVGTSCQMGVCTGGVKKTCTPPDPCSTAECDDVHNVCNVKPKPDGADCDDGSGCRKGTTCHAGDCKNPTKTITQCNNDDGCCPAGCGTQGDNDCLFWANGVQENVPVSSLIGWTQCFFDTYDDNSYFATGVPNDCAGGSVLMGCGQYDPMTGQVTVLQIAAMAAHDDVFFDCGQDPACVHQANGTGFYFSDNYSWGFAPGGAPVNRNSCDIGDDDSTSPLRMCVHSSGGDFNAGYRCGTAIPFDNTYARVAYKSPKPPPN